MDLIRARDALRDLEAAAPPHPGAVRLDLGGPVARLILDNPGARGAVTLGMMVQLADAVLALREWSGAALILSSADPRAFCAGGHLGQVRRAVTAGERARAMADAMTAILDALLELPIVSVAAVRGIAVGGGAEIATACDLRVVSPDARVHFVHARLGIAPGWGGTGRLVGIVGPRVALRVLTEARALDPSAAAAVGLVDAVAEDPLAEAERLLAPVVALPPEAVRAVKRQVRAAVRGERSGEAAAFEAVWGGPAHRAALEGLRKHG